MSICTFEREEKRREKVEVSLLRSRFVHTLCEIPADGGKNGVLESSFEKDQFVISVYLQHLSFPTHSPYVATNTSTIFFFSFAQTLAPPARPSPERTSDTGSCSKLGQPTNCGKWHKGEGPAQRQGRRGPVCEEVP